MFPGGGRWGCVARQSTRSQYLVVSLEVGPRAGDIAKAQRPDRLLVPGLTLRVV